MAIDINYLRAVQNTTGCSSKREAEVLDAKRNLTRELKTSLFLEETATRNGVQQPLIITPTQDASKSNVIALPDCPLYAGDYVECGGKTWVVTEVDETVLQCTGEMLLCNFTLRFQNGTSDIIERKAVLDPGVYSTTIGGQKPVFYPDNQYKVWLPLDDDTEHLHIDMRFAADYMYDQHDNKIMSVYKFTRFDGISRSFRPGDHLLLMNIKSDEYDPQRDNLELRICDYIAPTDGTGSTDSDRGWY